MEAKFGDMQNFNVSFCKKIAPHLHYVTYFLRGCMGGCTGKIYKNVLFITRLKLHAVKEFIDLTIHLMLGGRARHNESMHNEICNIISCFRCL